MIYKKIFIVFLILFIFFGFSTVFGADISTTNVSSDLNYYVQKDQKIFLNVLHNNNLYNINDFFKFVNNSGSTGQIFGYYYCICPVGYYVDASGSLSATNSLTRYVYFSRTTLLPQNNSGSGEWYNVQTDFKSLTCYGYITFKYTKSALTFHTANLPPTFPVPSCWQWYTMDELFNSDVVSSVVTNVNETLTDDTSSQTDIDLSTHNDEMNNASDTVKNSNLYNKFSNLSNEIQDEFTYNDDDVSTLPISFNNKNYVLRSDEISSFFKNNNLSFVVLLWQSILWFSLLYTMYLFIRKIYKSVAGGNPVDDVHKTLSSEDDKMIGGF